MKLDFALLCKRIALKVDEMLLLERFTLTSAAGKFDHEDFSVLLFRSKELTHSMSILSKKQHYRLYLNFREYLWDSEAKPSTLISSRGDYVFYPKVQTLEEIHFEFRTGTEFNTLTVSNDISEEKFFQYSTIHDLPVDYDQFKRLVQESDNFCNAVPRTITVFDTGTLSKEDTDSMECCMEELDQLLDATAISGEISDVFKKF